MRPTLVLPLLLFAGCKKAEQPALRTEPWPAPAVSASSSRKSSGIVRYELVQGSAEVELRGKRPSAVARLARLEGQVELDPLHIEKTRAELRADLLALDFEDPSLVLQALHALELGPDAPSEERERDRWAKLRIVGFENKPPSAGPRRPNRVSQVSAFAELTLHRFRVPVPIELEVELPSDPKAPLRVRTRRPIVVDLEAHDLAPLDLALAGSGAGSARYSEARVSAELSFRPRDFTGITLQ